MEKLTPENLREIFVNLQTTGLEAVVVGGQPSISGLINIAKSPLNSKSFSPLLVKILTSTEVR